MLRSAWCRPRYITLRQNQFAFSAFTTSSALSSNYLNDASDPEDHPALRDTRKSPAAEFGSRQIGSVVLPFELQDTIGRLFKSAKCPQLVVAPAQYSVISSVLTHVKQRLGHEWKVERVIDWGAGTGSALWASAYLFQKPPDIEQGITEDEPQLKHSTLGTYLAIDKRESLTLIGRRLLQDVNIGSLNIKWHRGFGGQDKASRLEASDTLAISSFNLSCLPNAIARKMLVNEMWESGAHVIVLIDRNTSPGFEYIAEARDRLLTLGRKELEDPATESWSVRGSHVVAPCPHDVACPLFQPGASKLTCSFSQRLQKPAVLNQTKQRTKDYEDVTYSYVVVRRGERPAISTIKSGRIGGVGRDALHEELQSSTPIKELKLHSDHIHGHTEAEDIPTPTALDILDAQSPTELQDALRIEAYGWPRLVFPPLKKGGHVIIDGCTTEGKIMRMTIPKSQGKQAYYDARKSSWGDIFPHEPKNRPQERYQPPQVKGEAPVTKGADIGKRRGADKRSKRSEKLLSYDTSSRELKENKKKLRQDRARARSTASNYL